MLQVFLCPFESMQTWTTDSVDPDYPGQDRKLRHASWLFDNILTAPKNLLATHLRAWDGNDESYASQVVNATVVFVEKWFPAASPGVPDVQTCVRMNDELPFTHAVTASEERTAFGFSS